jgi:hypothetical protein
MIIINISQEVHEMSSVLSIYKKTGIFHHDVGILEGEFQEIRRM